MKHKGQEEKRRKINDFKAKRAKQNLLFHCMLMAGKVTGVAGIFIFRTVA
jgi:hypothetical protein